MAWILPALTALGSLAGLLAKSRSDAKTAETKAATEQNNSELARWMALQNAEANRANAVSSRPTERLQQGALGNLVSGWSAPSVSWGGSGTIPTVSGGFAGVTPNAMLRENADLTQKDALLRQMEGESASDIPNIYQMPESASYPKESTLDKILGYAGLAGGLAGVWDQAKMSASQSSALPTGGQTTANGWYLDTDGVWKKR